METAEAETLVKHREKNGPRKLGPQVPDDSDKLQLVFFSLNTNPKKIRPTEKPPK